MVYNNRFLRVQKLKYQKIKSNRQTLNKVDIMDFPHMYCTTFQWSGGLLIQFIHIDILQLLHKYS